MIQFPKRFKLFKACEKETGLREGLKSVHFDGKRLEATNGHILAKIKPSTNNTEETLISQECIKESTKKREFIDASIYIEDDGLLTNGIKFPKPEHQNYPDTKKLINLVKEGIEAGEYIKIGLNAKALKDLSEALGSNELILYFNKEMIANQASNQCYTKVIGVEPLNPPTDEYEPFGLIMPIRLK